MVTHRPSPFVQLLTKKELLNAVYWTLASLFLAALVWACSSRFSHIYLEDDSLWCLPLIAKLKQSLPFEQMIHVFQSGELSLFDGLYFSALISLFGIHLKFYVLLSLLVHVGNAGLLFHLLLRRMQFPLKISFFAAAIYLTFYGHFHAYIRPLSISHTMVVFVILLLANLYLSIEQRRNNHQSFGVLYGLVMGVAIIASVMRLSMIIVPVMIVVHILFIAKDGAEVLGKLRLWGPVFFILLMYNWILLTVIGREGRTLDGLTRLWHGILHQDSWLLALLMYVGFWGAATGVVWVFLKSRAAKGFLGTFKKIILRAFFIPHFFLLSLYNWLVAVPSAVGADPYKRWQLMAYPEGTYFFVLLLGVWVLMAVIIKYIRSRSTHLILFAGWYLSLLPFLGLKLTAVPSRYLIYISPILAVVLSLFLFEILPQNFNFFRGRLGRYVVIVGVCLIIFSNIYAIHVRLRRSILGDYWWSYDYVKTANVIKGDLAGKGQPAGGQSTALCVQGVGAIGEWWKDFLWGRFDQYAPFVWTLRSTIGRADIPVRVNNQCRESDLVYRITDKTVVDGDSRDIEPFYQFFNKGIARLQSGDFSSAYVELNKAVVHPPFVIRLFLNKDRLNQDFSVQEFVDIAKTIKASYAHSYADDGRLHAIEYMIQKESMDYAFVVLLSAYLQDKHVYGTDRFWSGGSPSLVASQWITADDVKEYPLQDYLPASELKPFEAFATHWLVPVENMPWPKVENYRGYAFYVVNGYYFAILDQDGDFDLAKFKRGGYASSHVVKTKHELRRWVDQQDRGSGGSIFEAEEKLVADTLGQLSIIDKTNFSLPADVLSKYADAGLLDRFEYGMSVGGIPLGRGVLQAAMYGGEQKSVRFVVEIKPWPWLQKVSKDSLGWRMTSTVDRNTLLPEFFEENVLSKIKKGKSGRSVVYHHDQLYMERKIYKEDILPDTRDLASLLFWLMDRDYHDQQVVKTTMNISRNIYLIVGQAHDISLHSSQGAHTFRMDLRFIQMDHRFQAVRIWPVEMYFLRMKGWSLPVLINIGILPASMSFHLM